MIKKVCSGTAIAVLLSYASQACAADSVSSEGAFNPALSLILSGTYGTLRRDPEVPVTGFAMNPVNAHEQGFNLGESEIGISANIDPQFRGVATLSLDPAGGLSAENAFVQTTSLGDGLNFKFGRYFSGIGYLNDQHAHAWDFVDQPLVYTVLWDNQLGEDGVQLKWLAPTATFLEVGAEVGKGRGFPGTDRAKNGSGAGAVFLHLGDDVGIEHSWRAGLSLHKTRRVDAESFDVPDLNGNPVTDAFTGDSRTAGFDFVWKYAPNGNFRNKYIKVQAEYFRRRESGNLTYDATGSAPVTDTYTTNQSGWYLQGVYQFMPTWRSGLRYDRLDPGSASLGAANVSNVVSDYGYTPTRWTWMADYSPSEFSRVRLQLAHDNSRQGMADNQLFVQYVMSLGAHGAHQY